MIFTHVAAALIGGAVVYIREHKKCEERIEEEVRAAKEHYAEKNDISVKAKEPEKIEFSTEEPIKDIRGEDFEPVDYTKFASVKVSKPEPVREERTAEPVIHTTMIVEAEEIDELFNTYENATQESLLYFIEDDVVTDYDYHPIDSSLVSQQALDILHGNNTDSVFVFYKPKEILYEIVKEYGRLDDYIR